MPKNTTLSDVEVEIFKSAKLLCIDIETKDPNLIKMGPGTHRKDGHICGVSVGVVHEGLEIGKYIPLRHCDITDEVSAKNQSLVRTILKAPNEHLGANIIYDLEWLNHEGYETGTQRSHDVQYAEPLLNEYSHSYNLNTVAQKYGVGQKKTSVLEEYHKMMGFKGKAIENLWRMPSTIAAEYAVEDALLPLKIFKEQKLELERQNMMELYHMEVDLIPLLLKMRKQGVRLDMPLLEKTIFQVTEKHFDLKEQLFQWADTEFNPGSSSQLSKLFDARGIPYPRNAPTPLMKEAGKPGNPKLDKESLSVIAKNHPIAQTILDYRHFDTLINMFLHPYLNMQVNGRLYCSFHPLRSDDYGTVSGRFSSSKPNLQQVSAKTEGSEDDVDESSNVQDELKGQIVRQLFIPESGRRWAKLDYSQIEYRIMAHYATGKGSNELKEKYRSDKNTDFHKIIEELMSVDRRTAKRLNFGGAYGMGVETTARKFGWTMDQAELFILTYHNSAPYVKATRKAVTDAAKRRGYIFTLANRKARVHKSRSLYSFFNRLVQGSAADIMKQGMVTAWKAGVFDTLLPHITVHDEMDVSYEDTPEGNEALQELKRLMEEAIPIDVPVVVDCHTGINWSEAD